MGDFIVQDIYILITRQAAEFIISSNDVFLELKTPLSWFLDPYHDQLKHNWACQADLQQSRQISIQHSYWSSLDQATKLMWCLTQISTLPPCLHLCDSTMWNLFWAKDVNVSPFCQVSVTPTKMKFRSGKFSKSSRFLLMLCVKT